MAQTGWAARAAPAGVGKAVARLEAMVRAGTARQVGGAEAPAAWAGADWARAEAERTAWVLWVTDGSGSVDGGAEGWVVAAEVTGWLEVVRVETAAVDRRAEATAGAGVAEVELEAAERAVVGVEAAFAVAEEASVAE